MRPLVAVLARLIPPGLVPALLLLAPAACRRAELPGGLTDSSFVATMVELRRVRENATLDSTERAQARQVVLRRRGVTPKALEQAAAALANDPERASAVWQAVERQVTEPDSAPD
jgi:hypothetical protein